MLRRVYNRWNDDYQQHNCYDVISTTIICYDGMLTGQNCVFLFVACQKKKKKKKRPQRALITKPT